MIKEVKGVYAELRSTIDLHFHKIDEHAVQMAASVNVIPTMPWGYWKTVSQSQRTI